VLDDVQLRDRAAREACLACGLDPGGLALLRHGTNSVYRLRSAPVVVRVAPVWVDGGQVARQVAVARWLETEGVPAVRALAVPQPVRAQGLWVTFWDAVRGGSGGTTTRYGSAAELGGVLRRVHGLAPPASLHLPGLRPLAGAPARIDRLHGLAEDDRDLLRQRAERLNRRYDAQVLGLPAVPIHGDASVGNLLRDSAGGAVLADLDGFGVGPREWDLVLTAMYADLYGWHTAEEYHGFVAAYGYDVREWVGYPILSETRELIMVIWLAGNAAVSAEHRDELRTRFATLRTEKGRKGWVPL
jgi:aminoglycoside phosphotransferase (APT) family kinase protein